MTLHLVQGEGSPAMPPHAAHYPPRCALVLREQAQHAGYEVEEGCTDDGWYVTLVRPGQELHALGTTPHAALERALAMATSHALHSRHASRQAAR